MDVLPFSANLIYVGALISLLPMLLVTTTCFLKISIVLSLVRNAIGVQQIPPNMVIYSFSLLITVYIMTPTLVDAWTILSENYENNALTIADVIAGLEPFVRFMEKHTDSAQRAFFDQHINSFWDGDYGDDILNFMSLAPAFMATELTKAFQIGFLLYLPFIAVDIVVSNILLALGMMMVSPVTISLPFKLILFITADGWGSLIQSLIMSYK